ncbi:MAG TPA: glutathione peroxidase [bacterium]|nr:glutathione peroxidase [bacterium]
MKQTSLAVAAAALLALAVTPARATSFYDYNLQDIDGKPVSFDQFRGKVLLVVNTASRCGYTYQFDGLEALYKQYRDRGFLILGFPSNDFLGQEPGTNQQIKQFCTLSYGVSFPMFSKIKVTGQDMHPLYRYLTEKTTDPRFAGPISWNFNKFLIGRDGSIIARFRTQDEPQGPTVRAAIEAALGG